MRAWEVIALTEAVLLRILFPGAAFVVVIMLALRSALTWEQAPAVIGLLAGRLAPPLRASVGSTGDAPTPESS